MAVPVSNSKRIACAAKRTGVSPTILRAMLLREQYEFTDLRNAPLWAALTVDAGVEFPDSRQRREVLNHILALSADEIAEAKPGVVADILQRRRDLLEGVDQ